MFWGILFGFLMEIFINYLVGIEYIVMDECVMWVINGGFNKMCLLSNVVL